MLLEGHNSPCQDGRAADPPTDFTMADRPTKRRARYLIPDRTAETTAFVDFGLANGDPRERFRRLVFFGSEFLKVPVVCALTRKLVVEEEPRNLAFHARMVSRRRIFGTIETAHIDGNGF